MKLKLYIILICLALGCSSQNASIKKTPLPTAQNFVCLDSSRTKTEMKGYELTIPSHWCSYFGFHDLLSHSPRTLANLKENYHQNYLTLYHYHIDSYQSENIEDALNNHILSLPNTTKFSHAYTSDIHEIYGKYYIIKNKTIQHGYQLINLRALFNYKNRDYILSYYVLERDFDKYLEEVLQIMASFKIAE